MTKYRARMTNGKKHIFAECYTFALLQQWISDNEKLGFRLIGKIQKLYPGAVKPPLHKKGETT